MFFGRDTLKRNLVGDECILALLGAFVVKDAELDWVTLETNLFVERFTCISNARCFAVGESRGVDRIGVLLVEDEDVVVSSAGGNRKLACLVRVGFEDFLLGEEHAAEMVCSGGIVIVVGIG